jgi:parallel beta-helix repeat protein
MSRRSWLVALVLGGTTASAAAAPPPGYFMSLAVYRPSTHSFIALNDLNTPSSYALNGAFELAGDLPVVGDFDGNGIYDAAVFRSGTWYTDKTHTLTADPGVAFGQAGDVPLAGDFDGDGIADLVLYRNGIWIFKASGGGSLPNLALGGVAGDIPVVADFDGDGIADIAIFRAGTWYIRMSSTGTNTTDNFGDGTYTPCAADWNHDGKAELCLFRNGVWYFKAVGAVSTMDTYTFGAAGDIPLAGGAFDKNVLFVRAGAAGTQDGTLAHPYATISQARDHAVNGSVIRVAGGTYAGIYFYGPGVGGVNTSSNVKLLGAGRCHAGTSACPAHLAASSGDALVLQGAAGLTVENFNITATGSGGRGIVLAAWNWSNSVPGASATIAFNSITNSNNYGILVTAQSQATISHNTITGGSYSAIGLQGGPPANPTQATIAYNEIANNGPFGGSVGGNGIQATNSSIVTATGNYVHDNGRYGIGGIDDSHMTITGNVIDHNTFTGVIICSLTDNDPSSATITGNTISNNGIGSLQNGIEFTYKCGNSLQTVSGNIFDGNSGDGIYIGSGKVEVTGNTFSSNDIGITLQQANLSGVTSSQNTDVHAYGNNFTNNRVGFFAQIDSGAAHEMIVTVGGTQSGQVNHFSGQSTHAIGCLSPTAPTPPVLLNCPAGGNTFATSGDNVDVRCSCDDVFHDAFGP